MNKHTADSWAGGITCKRTTGYSRHDTPYCTHGNIATKEEALIRIMKVFKKRKYSLDTHYISVYTKAGGS